LYSILELYSENKLKKFDEKHSMGNAGIVWDVIGIIMKTLNSKFSHGIPEKLNYHFEPNFHQFPSSNQITK
jgi:hypothetical protein